MRALLRVFRGKYLEALGEAYRGGELRLAGGTAHLADPQHFKALLDTVRESDWVVYAKRPFAGPEQVLAYLGRYTHRVAIGNHRLLSCEDEIVRFRWRDYAHGSRTKTMGRSVPEFIRRFRFHVLPKGFMRIRHYGLLASRAKAGRLAAS